MPKSNSACLRCDAQLELARSIRVDDDDRETLDSPPFQGEEALLERARIRFGEHAAGGVEASVHFEHAAVK